MITETTIMKSKAIFSDDKEHRFILKKEWDNILSSIANNGVVCNAAKSGCKAIGFARTV